MVLNVVLLEVAEIEVLEVMLLEVEELELEVVEVDEAEDVVLVCTPGRGRRRPEHALGKRGPLFLFGKKACQRGPTDCCKGEVTKRSKESSKSVSKCLKNEAKLLNTSVHLKEIRITQPLCYLSARSGRVQGR